MNAVVGNIPEGGSVQITYYRTQAQYDELGRDEGPVGIANANARAIAQRLSDMGYMIGFAYPDDECNIYHSQGE